jgi:hypothetical protein
MHLRVIPSQIALFAVAVCAAAGQTPGEPVIAVENGRWFDGSGFEDRTFYIVDGLLEATRPARIDSVIDLRGRFVVPPLGDAHTHNLDGPFGLDEMRRAYRDEGTFYVQVLTNTTRGAEQVRDRFLVRCSIDVVYANGGLTSTLSHPFLAYEPRAMGLFDDWEAHAAEIRQSRIRERDAYWFNDDEAVLAEKWPRILAAEPGVIKIFLLDASESPAAEGGPGSSISTGVGVGVVTPPLWTSGAEGQIHIGPRLDGCPHRPPCSPTTMS